MFSWIGSEDEVGVSSVRSFLSLAVLSAEYFGRGALSTSTRVLFLLCFSVREVRRRPSGHPSRNRRFRSDLRPIEPCLRPFRRCDVANDNGNDGAHLGRRERHKTKHRTQGPEKRNREGSDGDRKRGPQQEETGLAAKRRTERAKEKNNGEN